MCHTKSGNTDIEDASVLPVLSVQYCGCDLICAQPCVFDIAQRYRCLEILHRLVQTCSEAVKNYRVSFNQNNVHLQLSAANELSKLDSTYHGFNCCYRCSVEKRLLCSCFQPQLPQLPQKLTHEHCLCCGFTRAGGCLKFRALRLTTAFCRSHRDEFIRRPCSKDT